MKYFLFNENGRLRSGWRAAFFLFAFSFVWVASHDLILSLTSGFGNDATTAVAVTYFSSGIYFATAALIIGWMCGWLFEGLRSFKSIGAGFSAHWLRHFLLGSLFGIVTLCFAVIIVFVSGGEYFESDTGASIREIALSSVVSFAVFAAVSALEEALFRGYVLQTFARDGLAWLAIVLTSAFFGAVHLRNPNAGLFSTLNTVLAGIWFGLAYLKTRDLWFVWGMHLMWNWTQGSVFGIEVSGVTFFSTAPILKEIDAGPNWLTGTTYGLEGGVACTVAILISIGLIYYLPGLRPDEEMLALSEPPAVAVG